MPLGEEIPLERGHQRGTPPLRNRYYYCLRGIVFVGVFFSVTTITHEPLHLAR